MFIPTLFFVGVFEILVEIARNHTVIELSDLVGTLAVKLFKRGVRGDYINLPGEK